MPLIFVYGTLKRGDVRAGALAGAKFLGEAHTEPRYRLYDCGEYPALIGAAAGEEGVAVEGEVYEVTPECLARLDEVEGVAESLYERGPIALRPPFSGVAVEAYFYRCPVAGLPELGSRWEQRG